MPILPLPQFEADLEEDRKAYQALKAPKTIVVRYGVLKMVGEFPYDGEAKPGCGSKLVVRTPRGTEIGEMLTTTCPNSGCGKSVSRKEMLDYVQNSGGRDYPFSTEGRILRIATGEDMEAQSRLTQAAHGMRMEAKRIAEHYAMPTKIVDVEQLLGGERVIVYFNSEERLDFRDLVRDLSAQWRTRVDMRQVGARDEARITADYERCGQYCCCKGFLKVLKPVSMRSAKIQKATLDPLKISGRCGRLMCCLRYEDQTYDELRKRLPKRKVRVGTPEGSGLVLDTQILTQLVLVLLDGPEGKQIAVAVEDLTAPDAAPPPPPPSPIPAPPAPRGAGGGAPQSPRPSVPQGPRPDARGGGRDGGGSGGPRRDDPRRQPPRDRPPPPPPRAPEPPRPIDIDDIEGDEMPDSADSGPPEQSDQPPQPGASGEGGRRRRRRRRRRGGGGGGGGGGQGGGAPSGGSAGPA